MLQNTYENPKPGFLFTIGSEAFNQYGSHIQGIAVSEDALYLSQDNHIAKVRWDGVLIKSIDVISHTGDLYWYKEELYSAVALSEMGGENSAGKGRIIVYNSNLNPIREIDVNRRIDGICCHNQVLYVGMGSKTQPSRDAHRVNLIGKYDTNTLQEIGQISEIEYGYETNYGVQNLTTDGTYIYGSFYAVNGPQIVMFDTDLKVINTFFLKAYHGFDLLPPTKDDDNCSFIWAETHYSQGSKGVITCSINVWHPNGE